MASNWSALALLNSAFRALRLIKGATRPPKAEYPIDSVPRKRYSGLKAWNPSPDVILKFGKKAALAAFRSYLLASTPYSAIRISGRLERSREGIPGATIGRAH